jgi:hypothetical protein
MGISRQASRFAGGTPDLAAEVVAGAAAKTEITVPGIRINDVVVAVINLTDGDTEVVESVGHRGIVVEGTTEGDKLVVLYWSVGRGGSPSGS